MPPTTRKQKFAMFAFAMSLGLIPMALVEKAEASSIVNDSGAAKVCSWRAIGASPIRTWVCK